MAYDDNVRAGFLENLKSKRLVTVFMKNGFQLRGKITRFDRYVIILEDNGREKMLYQGAISTIDPHRSPTPHYVNAP